MRLLTEKDIERMTKDEFEDWKKKVAINSICRMLYRLDYKYLLTVEAFARSMYKKFVCKK